MGEHVEGGRLRRLVRFAGVAARTTRDLLAAEARRRLLGQGEERLEAALGPTAERLVEVLGSLKGAAAKLGQFISLVDQDTFPEQARRILARLLSQSPHRIPYERVGELIAAELGAPPEELFASFSAEPCAAASLGQVHAARLKDGREVVVKVQYPGVERAVESDLRNLGLLARGLALGGGLLDGRQYVAEIEAVLRRELDYREEARQLALWREAARPWPQLVVPEVIAERSAQRVLTLERLAGPTLLEFAEDPQAGEQQRFEVGARLVEAIWGPFLRQGLIHADPHPGNYIVLPQGRLGVLDFGATRQLSPRFVLAYWKLVTEALAGKPRDLVAILETAGFRIEGEREQARAWLDGLAAIVERPLAPSYDWGQCRIAIHCREHATRHLGTALRCRAPVESLMFYRAAAGLAGDLRLLRARGPFRAVLERTIATARAHLAPELRAHAPPGLFEQQAAGHQEQAAA
ncbi:MAG: hypothetical protein KatS3mg102_0783 [Planctomycetota bacterium]|nr:MAG: hypothetical protein KatS3mg102_0783 [Planctomycetota bacterium]